MNKFGFKRLLTIVGISIFVTLANAQLKVGDNSNVINSNSVLELESTNKGMLLPRLALTSTTAAAPLSAHVAGMTVYNTATAGSSPTDVAPGYYYNDGTKWIRIATSSFTSAPISGNGSSSSPITMTPANFATFSSQAPVKDSIQSYAVQVEPWFNVATNKGATANTQNIYQMGNVGIGTTTPFTSALTVKGAYSGTQAIFGYDANNGNGLRLRADGASTHFNWQIDQQGISTGLNFVPSTTAGGSVFSTPTMTLLETGKVGIGYVSPLNRLHVRDVANPVRFEGLQLGAASDSIITADVSGVLRKRSAADIALEPWYDVATNKGATANTQNIYQMGSVGIGTNNPTKQLDVFSNGTTYVKVRGNGPGYTNATVELVATGAPNARGTGISMTDSIANNQWYVGRPYSGGTGNGNDVFVVQRKSSPLAGDDAAGHYTGGGLPNASNFFSIINNGNTGISSVNPTNKLDVNGDARVRVMADGATTDSVVTRDVNGVLRKRPANYLLNNLAPATNTLRDSILVNQGGNLRYNLSDCYEFNELVAPSQMQILMKVGATGYVGEGVAQYSFTVGNYTSGHSGTKTYIFGGGYTHGAMVIGQWYKLEPSMVGNGHGYGLDSMTFLVRNDDNYSHSFAIANGATGTNFNYYITACDMNPSFTNRLNFTVADSSATAQRPYSYTGTQQSPISKAIGNITVKNVSVNIPATMLGVRYTSTISVSGANIGDNVIVNPRTALPNGIGIAYSRVSAANTIEIGFNGTGSDPAATVIFDIKILK